MSVVASESSGDSLPHRRADGLPEFAGREVGAMAAGFAVLLFALSGRYGYHRDELYFIACGHHLAWGYPDQPVLAPLLARLMTALSATSLVVLRLPSDVAGALTLTFTGLTARELGFRRPAQILATAAMGLSSLVPATGHLLSTETFNLTAWAGVIWLALRALRSGDDRWWLAVGAGVGLGLLDSGLVLFVAAALLAGLLVAGPRRILVSPWLLAGGLLAVAMWAPYLVWQARHGWPEFAIAHSIATGGSGTSAPRAAFLPEQLLLSGPFLSPFLVVGLVVLARRRELRFARPLLVALVVLVVLFLVTDGKPYYLGGMFPLVFACGADAIQAWSRRRHPRRRAVGIAVLLVFGLPDLLITLPVLPVGQLHDTPIVAINYDAGETVGWPAYVEEVAAVYRRVPTDRRSGAIVLASNYGEAGAVERYGPALGLPATYAVQNAFWLWGPPPAGTTTTVAVGFDRSQLTRLFRRVEPGTVLDNHESVDDDEQGEPVYLCSGLRQPWTAVWPGLRDYG